MRSILFPPSNVSAVCSLRRLIVYRRARASSLPQDSIVTDRKDAAVEGISKS